MRQASIRHFWELLIGMTEKELRARYKHTVFGFLWLVANPVLQMLIIGFVFPLFVKETVEHYYFYLFAGLLAWNFFSLSLSKATSSVVNERSLIKKASFPRSTIPLSIILSNLIHYMAAFVLFLIPLSLLHTLTPWSALSFLTGLCALVIFTTGLSLLTSALNVRFRDINFFVQAILIVWFYATPIIYSLSQMPQEIRWIWRFNPLTAVMQYMQSALLHTAGPDQSMIIYNLLGIGLILISGIILFYRESKHFDDWL